jgi:hypothetical protein
MSDDKDAENPLRQFGLGPHDEAHDSGTAADEAEPAAGADDSSVNSVGMGAGDQERHRS